jgi:2-oxo-3-hexenedioate decarboxylase/2-keto-4-pentenoate hydratase|tara:strand:+ start:631 stop:1425 length:795 start_codon:yes stop_codon:yes gene_type:complete
LKDTLKLSSAACILASQRQSLIPIDSLSKALRPAEESQGYLLQKYVNRLLESSLGPVVGHKIGCTTPVMQKFLGIPTPCAGQIFSRTVLRRHGVVPREGFRRIGVECEIVALISETISPNDYCSLSFSPMDIIGSVMVGMEIVDDRYHSYESLGVPTLIADNFFNSGCVLGDAVTRWDTLDLSNLSGVTRVNGVALGKGRGAQIMGSPLNALRWFVRSMMDRGLTVQKGQFVMLGSVVETKWLEAGDVAEVEIDSLGSVSLTVE